MNSYPFRAERFLTCLLVFALLISMLSTFVFAEGEGEAEPTLSGTETNGSADVPEEKDEPEIAGTADEDVLSGENDSSDVPEDPVLPPAEEPSSAGEDVAPSYVGYDEETGLPIFHPDTLPEDYTPEMAYSDTEGADNSGALFVYHNSYSDGACQICGYPCPHSYSGNNCKWCGSVCRHPHHTRNGICLTCGMKCEHKWDMDSVCIDCGLTCIHEYVTDGTGETVCVTCGRPCDHEEWTEEGVCKACGYVCTHEGEKGDVCSVCGLAIEHEAEEPESPEPYETGTVQGALPVVLVGGILGVLVLLFFCLIARKTD